MPINKTKVLLITARADHGGGPRHVLDLAQNINKSQFEVFIASPDEEPYYSRYKKVAVESLIIPHRKFSLLSIYRLYRFILKHKITHIHSHGRGAGIYSRLLFIPGLKIIHTFHGVHLHQGFLARVYNLIEGLLSLRTDKFISIASNERKNANRLYISDEKIITIPNGINNIEFDLPSLQDSKIAGTLTRLETHKNNVALIKIFNKLPDYKLLIAGVGEEEQMLRSIAKDNISFLGAVSSPMDLLSQIDIFVSSSKGEGLPYSVLEALAAKKKVLLSNVYGHKELAADCPQIELFDLDNTDGFKEKLESLEQTELPNKYTLENMIQKLESLYLSLG